jgi:hypothetical protein
MADQQKRNTSSNRPGGNPGPYIDPSPGDTPDETDPIVARRRAIRTTSAARATTLLAKTRTAWAAGRAADGAPGVLRTPKPAAPTRNPTGTATTRAAPVAINAEASQRLKETQ